MSIIESLSEPIWQRVGWSLVHFVWQGAAVAVLAALAVRLLRVSRGDGRYGVYLGALVLMVSAPIATFLLIEPPAAPSQKLVASPVGLSDDPRVSAGGLRASPAPARGLDRLEGSESSAAWATDWASRARSTIDAALPYLLAGWLVGATLLSLRLSLAFAALHRLRRTASWPDAHLLARIRELSIRCGFSGAGFCRVLTSLAVREPLALGLLRPAVLIPVSMVTELPPHALDAIIAHELAHIRRHDLWVNLFQRIVEALGFFHPAVWWLSGRIRAERELCCDAVAIRATGQALEYARTLELLASNGPIAKSQDRQILAAALRPHRGELLDRVRHILGLMPCESRAVWWPAAALPILAIALIIAACATQPRKTAHVLQPGDDVIISVYELIAPGEDTILNRRVDSHGKLHLPVLGAVDAAGKTPEELRRKIAQALSSDEPRDSLPHVAAGSSGWYLDAVTGEHFVDSVTRIPPFNRPTGHEAVRAHFFTCGECTEKTKDQGGERFIGYYEKYADDVKSKLQERSDSFALYEMAFKGRLYSKDGKRWVGADSPEGAQIMADIQKLCPSKQLRYCPPRQPIASPTRSDPPGRVISADDKGAKLSLPKVKVELGSSSSTSEPSLQVRRRNVSDTQELGHAEPPPRRIFDLPQPRVNPSTTDPASAIIGVALAPTQADLEESRKLRSRYGELWSAPDNAETRKGFAELLQTAIDRLKAVPAKPPGLVDLPSSELARDVAITAGARRISQTEPLLKEFIPKHVLRALPSARAAAIWALGMMHDGKPDESLAAKLVERLFDQNPFDPEAHEVRLQCAVALGRMKAVKQLALLRNRYDNDGIEIKAACRWAIMRITGEELGPIVVRGMRAELEETDERPLRVNFTEVREGKTKGD